MVNTHMHMLDILYGTPSDPGPDPQAVPKIKHIDYQISLLLSLFHGPYTIHGVILIDILFHIRNFGCLETH